MTLEVNQLIVSTTNFVAGHRVVETKGQVFGVVVRSRGLGGNIIATLRSLGGGEIHEYTSLLEDTRRQAVDRMVQNATAMEANAILTMRFDSSEIGQTMSEVVAYGTAVVIESVAAS
jgi:uncharacterized protein YbjQ (UPF0145 family)